MDPATGLAIYFLPSIVALVRRHLSAPAIIVLNLLLGWTVLGWIFALVWLLTGYTRRTQRHEIAGRIVYVDPSPPPSAPLTRG